MPGPTKEEQGVICSQIGGGTFTFPPNVPGPVPSGTNAPGPTGAQCTDMTKMQTCSTAYQADMQSARSTRDAAKCTRALTDLMACLGPCR